MDNPIFRLEGVVQEHTAEKLQDFEGPLDLILYLLSKNKIEIQNIPIALLLDQYLAYLEQCRSMDLEIASDFISMAAHLMYIKTRMLLSIEDEEAQGEMDALIASLQERQQKETYLRVRSMTELLSPRSEFGRSTVTRQSEPLEHGRKIDYDHRRSDLVRTMESIFDRTERMAQSSRAAFSQILHREPYSISQKAGEIIRRLKECGVMRFFRLFQNARSRSEIVATFIAVLELCRARVIALTGADSDCTVRCEPNAPENYTL